MATATNTFSSESSLASPYATVADLLISLGGIGPERVRMTPSPGTATESDIAVLGDDRARCVELVDGVLVEKSMGFLESWAASLLISALVDYLKERNVGIVTAPDGMVRLAPGLIRAPDVAFYRWTRLPDGRIPEEGIPAIVPDLAVEILSPGNTVAEMTRKRDEYFAAGVSVVWLVEPRSKSVEIHRPDNALVRLGADDVLTCDDLLPGFAWPVGSWLGRAQGSYNNR